MQKNNTVTAIVGYCTRGVLVLLLLLFIGTGCVPVKNMTKVPPLEHAIYLAHRWVEEPWTEDEVEKLAQELQQANITTVYLHTGPFLQNGTVPKERYARADEFITLLRTLAPEVTVQAWLGQREARGGGILDLTSESTRKNIVETVGVVLENAPYDGIHLNIEPVITEDDSFTQTLQAVKESIGDKTLSLPLFQ